MISPARAAPFVLFAAVACSRDDRSAKRADAADEPLARVTAGERLAKIRDLRAKAVLVNAWATWCDSCEHELPTLQSLADKFAPSGVRVLLVSVDEPSERTLAMKFLDAHAIRLPSYL